MDFNDPRVSRGGNVWQHLRTFKKRLLDAVRVEDLKLDGEWIEHGNDWALTLPMVEMARKPVHIPDALYLYEPNVESQKARRREQEATTVRVVSRPRHPRLET